ncbi:HEAT repeat-containing protein 1-like [Homarus americanus]|uniref:HEAT repeat-containing protein 1-like n=1 Tax=Homarus americanus TaxID=6706 RepID=UPI001C486767|nr:HEAT repeat-containing protein 1-like [Homarus americanus]
MATSLATQLEKLKTPQTSILDEKRIRRSILFDSSEAAKYGRDILYEIGVSGFDELAEINSKFLQFKESLFGKTSKEFQRAVEDKATNRKLDENIEHFLLLLSPYIEKQAALKALEWLVYRFMINSMNIRALLMCIFPYYESALFIRVLQIIEHDGTEEWRWLKKAKKSGRPLTKQAVSTRWGHNQGFRKFLVEYLKKMLKVHSSEGNLKIAISFYFTTVVGGICLLEEVEEMHLSSIVQMLPKCLSSHCEIVAGMYFTIAQLSVKTKLSQDLINNILRLMIQENTPPESLMEQCVLCLLALTHHQKIDTFNYKTLMALEKNSIILKQIEMLAKTKSVAPFLSAYVTGYIRWLGSDSCELDASKKAKKFTAVIDQLESMPMSSSDAFKVLWSFFEAVKNNYKAIVSFNTLNLGTVLSRLEASHPEGHCQAVARMINKVNNSPAGKEYEKIIKVILTSQSGSTSFIHMVHPDDEIRLAAVKNFVKNVSKGQEKDTIVIKKHLKNMLTDEFPAIILEGLTFIKGLRMLDVSYIVNECQKLLTKSRGKGAKWGKVRNACLTILSQKLVDKYDSSMHMRVLYICLPFVLFPRNRWDITAAKIVLKSNLANNNSLLGNLSPVVSPYLLDNSKTKEYSSKVWKVLPQVLSTFSQEEHIALWNHVENQLGSEDCLLSHFMSMILLHCGLGDNKADKVLRLKMAHSLLDACLISLDMFKSSATKTSQNLEQPSLVDLEEYLEQVEGGAIPLPFLTQCLQQVVKVFRLPDFCSTLRYWHPDMESPAGEGNLMLLMKAMKGALQLERCGDVAARNSLVAQILEECLGSTERRYYFLTILWGWHGSHTFSNVIDETLQAWALSLGSALLGSQSVSLAWALGTSQPIVPALISALTHGSAVVRSGAIDCIKKLVRVIGGRLSKDNHYLLLEAIVMQADELIADGSHVSSLLAQFDNKPKSNSQQVAQALIGVVVLEKVPMHMKASLLFALSHVTSTAVLRELLPLANSILKMVSSLKEDSKLDVPTSYSLYYILLHFTPETCEVLESKDGWELFHKAITCSRRVLDLNDDLVLEGFVSPQSVLMDQVMSSKFFSSIRKEEVHSQLWSILISHVVESEDPSEATHLRKGLRKVSLDAAVIIKQIEALHLSDKVTSIKAAQAKRKRQKEQESHSNKLLVWRKLGLMLETIGVMASLGRPWLLVGPLCQCLLYTLTLDTVITDVVQQQILSALLHLLQKSVEELGEDVSKEVQLNIELIVQCIRSSVSPDTHRRAMLILAFAAKISPDVVMHNMMSIFTFMGTSLLRRDDSYSFQVIHQTIQSIVPTLIQCEEKKNLVVKLAQVCQVFVDALPDLPEHRRLSLFTQLTSTIDAGKNLWIILALMADSHIKRGNVIDATVTKEEERRGPPEDIQFALILCSQFSPVAQVYACCQLMKYINNLLKEKEDMIVQQSPSEKNSREDNDIICWDLYSLKQKCHFKYISTGIIAHLLSSDKFIGQVYEVTKEQEGELQDLYKQLLETTLCYLQTVTLICDQHKDKPRGRLFLSLQRKVVDVVDSVNAVLAPTMLIEVTKRLMTSPLPLVRCRALEIMCAKLQPNASFFSEEDIESLEPFIKILRKVALNSKEPPDNRQTALFTLHLLTKLVASQVPEKKIQSVLAAGVNLVCGEEDPRLMTQALLVVSEAVVALKAHCIAHLGQLMPIVIKLLDGDQDSEHLLLAAVTATHKLFENVPQLLSPYLESLVCGVCRLYTSKEGASAKESRLVMRLGVVRDTLVKQIEPRVLIPKLTKAYKILSETEVPALQTFMVMVERLVTHVDGKTLMSHKPALLNLFTQAMDLRTQKGDSETICTVEMNVSCALGKLLLRLNEHDNIAIFLSLQSWAVDATEENPSRLITFYRLADHVAGTFKVLFIIAKLADRLFSHAAGLLDRNNSLKHKDTVFGSGDEAEGQTSVLLQAVFDTLTKIFLYDSVNFTNQERFQLMVKPLTDQLENTFGSKEDYRERITNHLVPCITKFAIAIGDDSLWKTLNRQILLRVRNDDQPMVILAALETFRALMETLGEDFLQPLLADTMPYITEVLESTDPDVEAATREIFTNMEGILGDNLRAYLEY